MFELMATGKSTKAWRGRLQTAHGVIDTPAFISPEIAMEIQATLGSDIAIVLDKRSPYPCEYDYAAHSAETTARWAKRCKAKSKIRNRASAFFGTVHGATFGDLRKASAQAIVDLDFDGYAICGVSVGEPEEASTSSV